ncbi:MAG: hypothetical protein MJ085_04895 [Clostridia bacterium]|nr:hypothetical protein [Clostridia bacterium]
MSKKSKARSREEKNPALSAKRRRAMVQYLAIMFSVAIVLVVLSLFITLRNQKATMNDRLNDQKKTSLGLRENAAKLQQKNNAYELLTKAQLDYNAGDMDAFVDDFEELMSISDALTDNGEKLYFELMDVYNAEVGVETTDETQTD